MNGSPDSSMNTTAIHWAAGPNAVMEAFLVENPPVATVVNAWFIASNTGIPVSLYARTQSSVMVM